MSVIRFFIVALILQCGTVCASIESIPKLLDSVANLAAQKNRHHTAPFKTVALSIPVPLQNLPYATYPTDVEYNTVRFNYNKRFNVFPKALFAPTTIAEAQFVLAALKQYQLEFSVRSGGHCFEPGSLSSEYIFDLKNFNAIIPDINREEVYIGAGCLLNAVIETLGSLNYAIPTGTCPTVCVTGLTLGGGIGLLTRTYGLTCDSVKSITLLTAENEVIEVNENNHADLFWALKGAGNGSFGIVLGFTFQMHYLPVSSFYELLWTWDPAQTFEILSTWQKWVLTLPSSISSSIRLEYKEGIIGVKIIGIKVGAEPFTEWVSAFGALHPAVRIFQGSYSDNSQYWAAEPSLPFNKIKSKILFEPLSKKVIHKIIEYLTCLEKNQFNLRIFLNFDAFGGNVPNFHNSFAFKNTFGWWYQAVYWPLQTQDKLAESLINKIYYDTERYVSKYSYANATDYDLRCHYLKAYYGPYVNQLIKIKHQYDPENIFHWKQSIPLVR